LRREQRLAANNAARLVLVRSVSSPVIRPILEKPRESGFLLLILCDVLGIIFRVKGVFMDYAILKGEAEQKAAATIEVLKKEFAGLRTGRASVSLLDGVRVEVYGAEMPLNQIATVSTPEAQVISVAVWDASNTASVEKAIRDSGLGLNPMTAGGVIRLNMPPLTEERRKELVKVAKKYGEEAHIALRNVRQDLMQRIKKAEADKAISEDDMKKYSEDLQKVFDHNGTEIDAASKQKEQDIMSV
jgi:ribosome recycling factor